MENNAFLSWLIKKKRLKKKSAGDVRSRLKRVKKFVNLTTKSNAEQIVDKLNSNKSFCRLSMTVKSQMRIAVKLYFKYQNS